MRRWQKRVLLGLFGILFVAESVYVAYHLWVAYWRRAGATPEERGFRLALRLGCFTCHGMGGTQAMQTPMGDVPSWDGMTWIMYADTEDKIRNWILYGRADPSKPPSDRKKLRMPAYRDVLTDAQLADLVAFYQAVAFWRQPEDPLVERGRDIAQEKGCFHCHGPEGRLTMPNPGSFKGYIPAWNSPDFDELVRDERELREWILDGISQRMARNPAARFFIRRAKIRMPAYRDHLTEDELDALVAFIRWVRASGQKDNRRE